MSNTSEELAKIRQARYTAAAVVTVAGPALAVALSEGGVSKWIAFAVAVAGVLTGTAGSAYAAHNTRSQRAGGVFDAPPEVVEQTPADQIIQNIPVVVQNAAGAVAELDRVKQAATDALANAPILGDLAKAAIDQVRFPKL